MTESKTAHGGERRSLYSVAQIQHLLRVEFHRAQRYRFPIAVLVVSVDQLGHVRDRLGYDAKEQVLEAVVHLLQRGTRSSDFLGRTADDRLLVVLPHTGAAGMPVLAGRLSADADTLVAHGLPDVGRISLSVGWAASDSTPAAYHDALLSAAEAAHADAVARGADGRRAARS